MRVMEQVGLEIKREHAFGLLSGVTHLWRENFISDFKVKVGDQYIPGHKSVLASASVFFRGLFTHDQEVLKKGYVDLKDVTFGAVEQSMEFMYSGTADISMSNISGVAYVAEMLQLEGLSRLCSSYLRFNLTLENCLEAKLLADLYNWDDLGIVSREFVLDNFISLLSFGSFTSLETEKLKLCLKSLNLGHEASWKMIVAWVKASPDTRSSELLELLGIENFPTAFLIETILTDPLVVQSTSVKSFVVDALFSDLQKLKSVLSLKNVFSVRKMLKESNLSKEESSKAVLQFLLENFDSVLENDCYKNLSFKEVRLLCGSPEVKCSLEITKWHLIVGWVKHKKARKKYFPALFQLVLLGRLPIAFVESDVKPEELMKDFPECLGHLPSISMQREGVPEAETHMLVLISKKDHLYSLRFHNGTAKKMKLKLQSPVLPSYGKILNIEDRLVLLRGPFIWELGEDRTWKEGIISMEIHVKNETNVVVFQGAILIIDTSKSFQFHLTTRQSSKLPRCPLGQGFCIAGTEKNVFAMGGVRTSRDAVMLCQGAASQNGYWKEIPKMRVQRAHASAAVIDKRVYVMGGSYAGAMLDSVEFFDEEANYWMSVSRMHVSRCHFATFSHGNKLYAIGGDGAESYHEQRRQSVEVYCIDSDKWQIPAIGLNLPGKVAVCKVPQLFSAGLEAHESDATETKVEEYEVIVYKDCVEKNMTGATLSISDNTFDWVSTINIVINSCPDSVPSKWEPITCHFACRTKAVFRKSAELYLLSTLLDSSSDLVTVLQKSMNDEWEAVALTKPIGRKVKLRINAPCELIGVVNKVGRDKCHSPMAVLLDQPLPLSSSQYYGERNDAETVPQTEIEWQASSREMHDRLGSQAQIHEEQNVILAEYQKALRIPAQISEIIGCKGGKVGLHGCSLEFPADAVKEDKEMTVSVDNNPENFPPNLEPIAPILGFKPSMKFDKPVTVTMKTWFRAKEGEMLPIVLSSRKHGSDWKKVGNLTIGDTNEVKFTVRHFCKIGLGVLPEQADNGEFTLHNDIYIQKGTGQINSAFYLDGKSERDVWDIMRRRSYAAFSSKPILKIYGRREQTVSIRASLTSPPNTGLSEAHPSSQFQISDILRRQEHNVIFTPIPEFGSYKGLVKGEYIAEVDGQEADKTPLSRKWPVTLDPEGAPVCNIAGFMSQNRSHLTHSMTDSTLNVDVGQLKYS